MPSHDGVHVHSAPLHSACEPAVLVSVVIPTYNSRALIGQALAALDRQTMPADQFEVIVVDDGSTDCTGEFLAAHTSANLRRFWQPHSGMAGAGRNTGIRQATGKYLFFHDADDYLGDDALRRLVSTAEREGADVVVGRARWGGQPPPTSTGAEVVLDADLLLDGVWRSLSPHKLIRRALVDRLDLTFHEDMRQGEDQVFVASCLFAADKISVLRDYDYYYRQLRDDGQNVSRQPQSLHNKWLTCSRMAALITQHTVPGGRREALFRRVMVGTLAPALSRPFMMASLEDRNAFLSDVKREVLPHITPRHLDRAKETARMRLAVADLSDARALAGLNQALSRSPHFRVDEGIVTRDLGAELNSLLCPRLRRVDITALAHHVRRVERLASGFRLTLHVGGSPVPIHEFDVLASLRGGSVQVLTKAHPAAADELLVTIAPRDLQSRGRPDRTRVTEPEPDQIWDFTLEGRFDDIVVTTQRLTWRASAVDPDALANDARWKGRLARLRARLYSTQHSNVSLVISQRAGRQFEYQLRSHERAIRSG